MADSLGMILMSQGSAEEGHYSIAGELVDVSPVLVDIIQKELETSVLDRADFLLISMGVGRSSQSLAETSLVFPSQ
jgi:hypothetical protein